MMENNDILKAKIQKLLKDIKVYEQAISDAQNALDAAERELNEAMEEQLEKYRAEEEISGQQ
ncbi:MAG: hypothetical protein IK133_03000 [Clostridia bacterium]|nr:hypothetical protein [Clostridia bacterium]MBR5382767.1 hypothetical protein [Clostridia bacterium]